MRWSGAIRPLTRVLALQYTLPTIHFLRADMLSAWFVTVSITAYTLLEKRVSQVPNLEPLSCFFGLA